MDLKLELDLFHSSVYDVIIIVGVSETFLSKLLQNMPL